MSKEIFKTLNKRSEYNFEVNMETEMLVNILSLLSISTLILSIIYLALERIKK